jgi:hypothetical protein
MSEFPHDDFAKAYLTELLSLIGTARPNHPLKAETRLADLWFEFNPQRQNQQQLGLLGQLLTKDSLIEIFRDPASFVEIRSCQGKLSHLEVELIGKANRRHQTLLEADLPDLWFIMPTASADIRASFGAQPTEHSGVYHLPRGQRSHLIVVHQLAPTEDTLWLRLLGRNGKQQRAIEEFAQVPTNNDLYASIEELLADYRTNLESRRQPTQEDEELIMQLSTAYLKRRQEWRDEARAEGLQEGRQEGRQESLRSVAIGLLREGIATNIISKTTGLSIEAIGQLQQELED